MGRGRSGCICGKYNLIHGSTRTTTTGLIMTSNLLALAKALFLPRRISAPAFVRPFHRILIGVGTGTGTETETADEIRTEDVDNSNDFDVGVGVGVNVDADVDKFDGKEQEKEEKRSFLFESLVGRSRNINKSNNNRVRERDGGPITSLIARHALQDVRKEYYRSAITTSNTNNTNNDNNLNLNIQRRQDQQGQDQQQRPQENNSSSPSTPLLLSSHVLSTTTTTATNLSVPVGDEYLYLAQ